MLLEKRENGTYIITKQKHKNKDIVIKLDSILKTSAVFFDGYNQKSENINWRLKLNNDKLQIELATHLTTVKIDLSKEETEQVIEDLIAMVKSNLFIESSQLLNKLLNKAYNELFKRCFKLEHTTLYSNEIVEGNIQVTENNKILGHATRFILDRGSFTVCEYSGNTIHRDTNLKMNIQIDSNIFFGYMTSHSINKEEVNLYTKGSSIGYLQYKGAAVRTRVPVNIEDVCKLNLPYNYTKKEKMIDYILENNSREDIIKYKKALVGKIELININKYMLNEFLT